MESLAIRVGNEVKVTATWEQLERIGVDTVFTPIMNKQGIVTHDFKDGFVTVKFQDTEHGIYEYDLMYYMLQVVRDKS